MVSKDTSLFTSLNFWTVLFIFFPHKQGLNVRYPCFFFFLLLSPTLSKQQIILSFNYLAIVTLYIFFPFSKLVYLLVTLYIFLNMCEDYLKLYYKFDINFFGYSVIVRNEDYFGFDQLFFNIFFIFQLVNQNHDFCIL